MPPIMRSLIVVGLLSLLAGCGREPETVVDPGLLGHVPADTPYVFVASRPLPPALRDRFADHAAVQLAGQREHLLRARAQLADAESAAMAEEFGPALDILDALLAEFEGRTTAAKLREIGIEPIPRAVYYGIGLLPAARIEITDADALNALLDRIETRAGVKARQGERQGQAYRRIDLGAVDAVLAVTPTHLVAGLLADNRFDNDLALLLGQQAPAQSLADSGEIEDLLRRHGFSGYGDGFVKLDALAATLLGQSQGLNAEVMKALGAEAAPVSNGCLQLLEGLVGGMPRMVVGVSQADDAQVAVRGIWESSDAVAAYLQRLAAPVPGVGGDYEGLVAIGMGLDLPQLRNGIEALLRQVIAEGRECEWVEPRTLEAAIPQLSLVLGPMTAGIKGFNLLLEDIEVPPQTLQPQAVQASLLAAVDDPRGVFALGAMFHPALGAIEVPTDGTPVALPRNLVGDRETPPLKVAMKNKALLLLAGDHPSGDANRLFEAPTIAPAPLFAVDYGVQRLVEVFGGLLEETAEQLAAQGETEMAGQLVAQLEDFRMQAELFERMRVSVYANEQGLVMDQVMELR